MGGTDKPLGIRVLTSCWDNTESSLLHAYSYSFQVLLSMSTGSALWVLGPNSKTFFFFHEN